MDKLFVLPSNFEDKIEKVGVKYFCPDCALILGFLSYFPDIKNHIELIEIPFSRPRKNIVDLLGVDNQSCPVLILDDAELDLFPGISIHQVGSYHFINDPKDITRYLGAKNKVSTPH